MDFAAEVVWPSRSKSQRDDLIRQMGEANPLWKTPRVTGNLLKLGIEVSELGVSRQGSQHHRPRLRTWTVFLNSSVTELVSVNSLTVPTVSFCALLVLLVLAHRRRRVIYSSVTGHPAGNGAGHRIVKYFPEDTAPLHLLRHREMVYKKEFESVSQAWY